MDIRTPTVPEQPLRAEACHARDVLDRVGDKWSVSVIYLLGSGTKRFTTLLRGIEGISQRMLTVTLRGLERDGLVTRLVHPVVPPRVDYDLTPMGRTLLSTVSELLAWAHEHTADIDSARRAYDARRTSDHIGDGPAAGSGILAEGDRPISLAGR